MSYSSTDDTETDNMHEQEDNEIQLLDPVEIFKNNKKEFVYFKKVDHYFKKCSDENITLMKSIIDGTSNISLRVLDWLVTRYSKSIIVTDDVLGTFNIHISYKAQLKTYKKKYFDPFKRRHKFYYKQNEEKTDVFLTTLGQLNFFQWAFTNNIIKYVENNLENLLKAMNSSNKHDKKKKQKKKESENGTKKDKPQNGKTKHMITNDDLNDSSIIVSFDD